MTDKNDRAVAQGMKVTSQQELLHKVKRILLVLNGVLYLVFVALVLIFNFLPQEETPLCGLRVQREQSMSSQYAVSGLYSFHSSLM
jgi:hypothetical protein